MPQIVKSIANNNAYTNIYKQWICICMPHLYRMPRTWGELPHTTTSSSQSRLEFWSCRPASMSSSSSLPSTSLMALPRWTPSTWNNHNNQCQYGSWAGNHQLTVVVFRQSLVFLEIQKTPIAPVNAQYLHRGSIKYEFASELLQSPIMLIKITNPQAQVFLEVVIWQVYILCIISNEYCFCNLISFFCSINRLWSSSTILSSTTCKQFTKRPPWSF